MEIKRDYSIDYLKAFGCILMLIGHPLVFDYGNFLHLNIQYFTHFAPVFFYAISGVTTIFQTGRKPFKHILFYYTILFLCGFTWGLGLRQGTLGFQWLEIISLIAIGCLFVAIIEMKIKPRNYVYFIIAMSIYGIKYATDIFIPEFGFKGFFFPPDLPAKQMPIYSGFPIFPWIFLFPLGIFMYRTKNRNNLILFLLFTAIYITLHITTKIDFYKFINKWDMKFHYFVLANMFAFFSFFIMRLIGTKAYSRPNIFLTIGQKSLLFLYVHAIGIAIAAGITVNALQMKNQWLLWIMGFVVTIPLFIVINKIKESKLFLNIKAWYFLIVIILGLPFIVKNGILLLWLEAILGVIFALQYKQLSIILKEKFSQETA